MMRLPAAALILSTLVAGPALAHGGHAEGLVAGLAHPLFGPDHLIGMIAVGLWAARSVMGRAWVLPATFLGGMACGIALGLAVPLPGAVEHGVAATLLALGLILAIALPLPGAVALPAAALFGLLHGSVHGAEIGGTVAWTATGMLVASALLHAIGFGIGRLASDRDAIARVGGAGIAAAGLALMFAG